MKEPIAIVGAGNGGQAFAGYLALGGERVKIFDVFPETVKKLNEAGGVTLEGNSKRKGFGKIEKATDKMEEVMEGAKLIMIVLPSLYHAEMARQMAPHLKDGQVVLLNPHASMGPVEVRKVLDDCGVKADVTLGCTSTLLFACRAVEVGRVSVAGQKQHLFAAAYPSSRNGVLAEIFKDLDIPEFEVVDDVIRNSLENINAFVHPAPTILNTGRIESKTPFEYYIDCTPAQGRYVDALDKERMALGKAYGLDKMRTLVEEYRAMYRTHGDNMYEILSNNEDLRGIKGQSSLNTRYVMEDVPCSLVALQSLGKLAGVPTPCIDAMITVGRTLLPDMIEGRTLKNLGLEGKTKEEFIKMCRQ